MRISMQVSYFKLHEAGVIPLTDSLCTGLAFLQRAFKSLDLLTGYDYSCTILKSNNYVRCLQTHPMSTHEACVQFPFLDKYIQSPGRAEFMYVCMCDYTHLYLCELCVQVNEQISPSMPITLHYLLHHTLHVCCTEKAIILLRRNSKLLLSHASE